MSMRDRLKGALGEARGLGHVVEYFVLGRADEQALMAENEPLTVFAPKYPIPSGMDGVFCGVPFRRDGGDGQTRLVNTDGATHAF